MLDKQFRQTLLEQKDWEKAIRLIPNEADNGRTYVKHSNPALRRDRILEQAGKAIEDLVLLADYLPEKEHSMLFDRERSLAFVDAFLGYNARERLYSQSSELRQKHEQLKASGTHQELQKKIDKIVSRLIEEKGISKEKLSDEKLKELREIVRYRLLDIQEQELLHSIDDALQRYNQSVDVAVKLRTEFMENRTLLAIVMAQELLNYIASQAPMFNQYLGPLVTDRIVQVKDHLNNFQLEIIRSSNLTKK